MSLIYEGTILTPDYKAKERTHNKLIAEQLDTIRLLNARITDLETQLKEKYQKIDELMVVLKSAKKKTRSRKIWKTKEAEGVK